MIPSPAPRGPGSDHVKSTRILIGFLHLALALLLLMGAQGSARIRAPVKHVHLIHARSSRSTQDSATVEKAATGAIVLGSVPHSQLSESSTASIGPIALGASPDKQNSWAPAQLGPPAQVETAYPRAAAAPIRPDPGFAGPPLPWRVSVSATGPPSL